MGSYQFTASSPFILAGNKLSAGTYQHQTENSTICCRANSADQIFLDAMKEAIQVHLTDENFSVEKWAVKSIPKSFKYPHTTQKLIVETPSAMVTRIRSDLEAKLHSQKAVSISEFADSVGFKRYSAFFMGIPRTF